MYSCYFLKLIKLSAATLSNLLVIPKDTQLLTDNRCCLARNPSANKQTTSVAKSEKPSVKFAEKPQEQKAPPSKPGHLGGQLGAVKRDERKYACIHGAECNFRHGKTDQRLLDLVVSMPAAAQTDLKKAIGSRK